MDEVVAESRVAVGSVTTKHSMSTTVRDSAELLNVEMDHLPRMFPLVATNYSAAWSVHPIQTVQPVSAEHLVASRARPAEAGSQLMRPQLFSPPQLEDARLGIGTQLPRTSRRTAATIQQSILALSLEAMPPLVDGGSRNAQLIGDHTRRPASTEPLYE